MTVLDCRRRVRFNPTRGHALRSSGEVRSAVSRRYSTTIPDRPMFEEAEADAPGLSSSVSALCALGGRCRQTSRRTAPDSVAALVEQKGTEDGAALHVTS